jgi:hypothetical protein
MDVTFSDNSASSHGGGMYNTSSSTVLTNVTFSANSAYGGGGMYNSSCSPTLTDVTFSTNSATVGGGMYNSSSSPTLTDVTFSANGANNGGGMYNIYSSPVLTNVTFYANSVSDHGGGMYNNTSNPTLTNAILWGNTATSAGSQIYDVNGSVPVVTYSDIQDGYGSPGDFNIDEDPLLGPLADNGGFTLMHALGSSSPAIDAGSPTICPATDQRGWLRPVDGDGNGMGICDMGAYEYYLIPTYLPLVIR